MTEENEETYRNNNIRRLCEKKFLIKKVRDHCHLTGNYRGPAHSVCITNVTQKHSNFISVIFHNFSNNDCHIFTKRLVDKKNDQVKFDITPKTNVEYISVTYGCIRFIDSYSFLSKSLDSLAKTLVDNSHKTFENLTKDIIDNDEILDIINKIVEDHRTFEDFKKDYPELKI